MFVLVHSSSQPYKYVFPKEGKRKRHKLNDRYGEEVGWMTVRQILRPSLYRDSGRSQRARLQKELGLEQFRLIMERV